MKSMRGRISKQREELIKSLEKRQRKTIEAIRREDETTYCTKMCRV